jgi:hypothetical protein
MSVRRCLLSTRALGTLVGALLLAMTTTAGILAQQRIGPSPQTAKEMQRQAELSAIEASKASIVSEVVSRWASEANKLGFTEGWDTELSASLARLDAERLLLARSAKTYRELNAIISGVSADSLARLMAAAPSIDANAVPSVSDAAAAPPIGQIFGADASDLVFFPMTPCRIVDTRVAGGAFANTNDRGYADDLADFSAQGGNPLGCAGIAVADEPAAIAVNITVTSTTGSGFLRAYPQGATLPFASILNWGPGNTLANSTILAVGQNVGFDFRIRFDGSGTTQVIVDILGYFWSPTRSALSTQIVEVSQNSTAIGSTWNLLASCPAGTSATGGGFDTTYGFVPTNYGPLQHMENGPEGNGWRCRGTNDTNEVLNTVWCRAVCARTPGR